MTSRDRKKLWARLAGKVNYMGDNFPHIVAEIDRAVRKARREARSEATTCVDCRLALLGEVPLCEKCESLRTHYGVDLYRRKRFYPEKARRDEDADCAEACDGADTSGLTARGK